MIDSAGIKMALGQNIACERIEGVNDNMCKSHYHDFFELYYLESGERYHMIHDTLYLMHAGQFILFAPYVMHHSYGAKDVPFKRIVIYFKASEIQSSALINALEKGSGVYTANVKDIYSLDELFTMLLKEDASSSSFKNEYMHTLLNMLLINTLRGVTEPIAHVKQNRIGQVVDYIHNYYFENITLEYLSKQFFVSPYHLCREFKSYTNRTIIQYINVTRIMNAQRKIMETTKSITEIGNETGFSNVTHFNRVFKNITGMTPSEYRKLYKNTSQ